MGNNDVRFLLVDDDAACRRMLAQIIDEEALGEVVGEKDSGIDVELLVMKTQPEVIIIDLLMPGQDGITTITKLNEWGYKGSVVMLSQVKDKAIIAQAYKVGVELFITKPINRIEVVSVLQRVLETKMLRTSIEKVKESLAILEGHSQDNHGKFNGELEIIKDKTKEVLSELGIAGEPGSQHLVEIISYIYAAGDKEKHIGNLKNLYYNIAKGTSASQKKANAQVVEQRIRRAVKNAMTNVAAIGLEDYHDPKFEFYASRFFDFNELRQKMKEIDTNEGPQARINIKKFISALYITIKN